MNTRLRTAPELRASQWFNTSQALSLAGLRGKVVMIEVFQMLCPGCVSHGLPQASRVHDTFPADQVQVIGLHSVFEHHTAMTPVALEAFLYEYRIRFPVAVDRAAEQGAIPQTMARYQMQGTPTLLLVDRQGHLRKQHFGLESDLRLGAEIMTLINESEHAGNQPEHRTAATDKTTAPDSHSQTAAPRCDSHGCTPGGHAVNHDP